MKTLAIALFLAVAASGVFGAGEAGSPSPAELRIEGAQKVLQKQPNRYQTYSDLALAFVRRARETGDSSYYEQAGAAIASSLRIAPENFEAQQAQVDLLLAEHNYRQALDEARALNHRMPDAVLVWGYMAEAEAALGDYQQAEDAAQWMMNLRPGNLPAYLTGADLRQDWGDIDGAEEYFSKALQQTAPFESEDEDGEAPAAVWAPRHGRSAATEVAEDFSRLLPFSRRIGRSPPSPTTFLRSS
jgi:tetratricopeptide (TPR) repeat protein